MTGQVDGDERSVERHRNGVPRVRVLRAAVEEHVLRVVGAPHKRADTPTVGQRHALAANGRWTVVRQPELLRVLVEQPELVVLDSLHAHPQPRPTSNLRRQTVVGAV